MNCATHSDQAAVAFCRTCGKPLCNQCTRDVRGVIYCESCLAARMEVAAAGDAVCPASTATAQRVSTHWRAGCLRPASTGLYRPESDGRGDSRSYPAGPWRRLLRAIRQRTRLPRNRCADHRCSIPKHTGDGARRDRALHGVFLGLSDHRLSTHREGNSARHPRA